MTTTPIDSLGGLKPPSRAQLPESALAVSSSRSEGPVSVAVPELSDTVEVSAEATARNPRSVQDGSQSPSPREAANQRLREMVERASSRMTLVSFALAEQGGDLQVNVVNRESGEVVRRIPPDEILHLRQVLEDLRGLLISEVT